MELFRNLVVRWSWTILLSVTISTLGLGQSPQSGTSPGVVGSQSGSGFVGVTLNGSDSRVRLAPFRDNMAAIELRGKYLSALIGGFEQGAGLPVGVELSTAGKIPGVELRARAITSTRHYQRLEAGLWIPKLGETQNRLDLWVGYRRRTRDNLFSHGQQSPNRPETNYATEQRSINLVYTRQVARGIEAGAYSQLASGNAYPGSERGTDDLPIDQLFSTNPASPSWLPGLHTDVRTLTAGLFAQIDHRNNDIGLTRGYYIYARLASTDGLKHDRFSDFGWWETELDGQTFLRLGGERNSLALRGLALLKQPRGGSQIPFYDLALMGGRTLHRGYRNFRLRGNNLVVLTVEPRRTIHRRSETRGVDAFVFGDAGQIWGDNRPAAVSSRHLAAANWRYALGGGLQYRHNRTVAFRIEIAHGREDLRAFVSMTRGF